MSMVDCVQVKHPLGRLFERRTLHACGACSLYGLWHVCSCCRKQHYCSPACQRAHLPQHLSQCKPVVSACCLLLHRGIVPHASTRSCRHPQVSQ